MAISFNERTLILENYGSPLRVITLDEGSISGEFTKTLSKAFGVPEKKVFTFDNWKHIRDVIVSLLSNESMTSEYLKIQRKTRRVNERFLRNHFIRSREQFIEWSNEIEGIDYFCNSIAMRTMFLSSEGSMKTSYNEIKLTPLDEELDEFIFNCIVSKEKQGITQEDYSYWKKISTFLLEPVSNRFKDDFKELYSYEIPYGLSPKTDKTSLEGILSQAKNASIIPIVQGSMEIGNAISSHEWVLAIEAAATSGATVLILVGSVKAAEVVYKWQRNK